MEILIKIVKFNTFQLPKHLHPVLSVSILKLESESLFLIDQTK